MKVQRSRVSRRRCGDSFWAEQVVVSRKIGARINFYQGLRGRFPIRLTAPPLSPYWSERARSGLLHTIHANMNLHKMLITYPIL